MPIHNRVDGLWFIQTLECQTPMWPGEPQPYVTKNRMNAMNVTLAWPATSRSCYIPYDWNRRRRGKRVSWILVTELQKELPGGRRAATARSIHGAEGSQCLSLAGPPDGRGKERVGSPQVRRQAEQGQHHPTAVSPPTQPLFPPPLKARNPHVQHSRHESPCAFLRMERGRRET